MHCTTHTSKQLMKPYRSYFCCSSIFFQPRRLRSFRNIGERIQGMKILPRKQRPTADDDESLNDADDEQGQGDTSSNTKISDEIPLETPSKYSILERRDRTFSFNQVKESPPPSSDVIALKIPYEYYVKVKKNFL